MAPTEAATDPDEVVLCGPSAVCAAGATLAEIASATNGCLRPLLTDARLARRGDGSAVSAGRVAAVDDIPAPVERMIQLARLAVVPGVQAWQAALQAARLAGHEAAQVDAIADSYSLLPVLLAVPSERPGLDAAALDWIAANGLEEIEGIDPARSGAWRSRHDGFAAVLEVAVARVLAGHADAIGVGAVDSVLDPICTAWLEADGRLRSKHQPNGLVPGEGAAFCIVTRASRAAALGLRYITVSAIARTQEANPWYAERPTLGDGLTTALRHALDAGPVDVCYADLNGESWRSVEWDYAYLRNGRHFAHPLDLRHPAQSWGDTGAASGALLTMLAAWDLWQGRALQSAALIVTSADTEPTRAAFRLVLHRSQHA